MKKKHTQHLSSSSNEYVGTVVNTSTMHEFVLCKKKSQQSQQANNADSVLYYYHGNLKHYVINCPIKKKAKTARDGNDQANLCSYILKRNLTNLAMMKLSWILKISKWVKLPQLVMTEEGAL